MNRIFYCGQQSDLWFAAHRGRITASGVSSMMAPPTTRKSTRKGVEFPAGSEAAERADYREKLIVERLYKHTPDNFVTRAMQDGLDREPFARMLYEADTQQPVEQIGFALHPEWDWFGCSPDGLLPNGGLELKCPTDTVHDSYAKDVSLLIADYQWQCVTGMICFPDFEFWDLASFNPYAPEKIKLVRTRLYRKDFTEILKAIEDEAQSFNAGIEAAIAERGFPPTVWDLMPDQTKQYGEPATDAGDMSEWADDLHGELMP